MKGDKPTRLQVDRLILIFWRTYDQKEIDCIEEHGGRIFGYEFKWHESEIRRVTRKEFSEAYPDSVLTTVNQDSFEDFLAKRKIR